MQRARKGGGEAPGSVRTHMRAEGSCLSVCYPDGGSVMEEVFGAAPGEGFISDCVTLKPFRSDIPKSAQSCNQDDVLQSSSPQLQ